MRAPALLLVLALLAAPAALADIARPAPEAATGTGAPKGAVAERFMVAAAHPLAAEAGREMLAAGGSAVDAAIAAQLVLNLVEPQSSGLGGGAFLLHWDAAGGRLGAWDGRETAPAAARPDRFLDPDGRPLEFPDAVVGGLSVGVPGLPRLIEAVHREHGKLPWARLFEPAIRLAEGGFPVSERLSALLEADAALRRFEPARSYFYGADGKARAPGAVLVNRPFAALLRRLAARGMDAFYEGEIAAAIVGAVRTAPRRPGDMTLADMAAYRVVERGALCRPYRAWRVCGMPPPTSGGIALLQMLALLEGFDVGALPPDSPMPGHLLAEAGRLAFADRDRYIADPDFAEVPVAGLLDDGYLRGRAALIRRDRALGKAEPGEPPRRAGRWGDGASPEIPSTTHISVVDGDGNAVAMTSSIEGAFGSRLMVHGFLLNNQLTDFSFRPEVDGAPVANRVEGGKRPRSSMAPTLVFDGAGRLTLVLGSPGGARIIGYVARTLVAMLDWGMAPAAAVALPHVTNRNGPTEVEAGTAAEAWRPALEALGHEVRAADMTSGLHVVGVGPRGLSGGADPRREGVALGE